MYIALFILIVLASLLLILAVLAQHPKSGMAANFGASNQVMGARQTSDFLEKFTWGTAISIVILSVATSVTINSPNAGGSGSAIIDSIVEEQKQESNLEDVNTIDVPTTTFENLEDVIETSATTDSL